MRLWATDGTANWLLWRIPDLRGRIAYDVRFELYDEAALDRIVRYGRREGDWQAVLDGYDPIVVEARPRVERRGNCSPRKAPTACSATMRLTIVSRPG